MIASAITDFISKHSEFAMLMALAFVMTMRAKLPWPLNRVEIFNWCYEWLHDAMRAFANSRQPTATAQIESHTQTPGKTESSTVTLTQDAPVKPQEKPDDSKSHS